MKTKTTLLNIKERFMEKVTNDWKWKGAKNKDGYGQIKFLGKQTGAHVISYQLFNGNIPLGALVLHTCDEPDCVNPEHLYLGNHNDNMRDRMVHGHYNNMLGISNMNAKLTDDQIKEIKDICASKKYTQLEVGKMFDVHQSSISRYVLGKVRHVA